MKVQNVLLLLLYALIICPSLQQNRQLQLEDEIEQNQTRGEITSSYPSELLTYDQIKKGGFILYFIGIMYCFLGISLATQNYINPAIDIIKKKGVFSSDSINATLLAMTNSAAESFIIMNSIFFGVSDIGMNTVIQQTAFYSLVIQGVFYMIAENLTRIDWWIITRDTVYIIIYLVVLTMFLLGNQVQIWKALVLFILYFVHIILMKYNQIYEVAIKKSVARSLEIKEFTNLARSNIEELHKIKLGKCYTIEQLNRIIFRVEENFIVFDQQNKKKIKRITCVNFRDEMLEYQEKRQLVARIRFKKAVMNILIKIQAYNWSEMIRRSQKSKVKLLRMLKDHDNQDSDNNSEDSDFFDDNDNLNQGEKDSQSLKSARSFRSKQSQKNSGTYNRAKSMKNRSVTIQDQSMKQKSPRDIEPSGFNQDFDEQENSSKNTQSFVQGTVYDMIHDAISKDEFSIKAPKGLKNITIYCFLLPLTHLQYYSTPNPHEKGKENFYPLTIFVSMLWIWFYTFLIVWWTFSLTSAMGLHYSVIPMILYPIGISIRDRKKLVDFRSTMKLFKEEIQDQEIALAEHYSGPIFQITGLMGLAWTLAILIQGNDVSFINEGIQYQAPILLGVVSFKYVLLAVNGFKSKRIIFYINSCAYLVFLIVVLMIDYREFMFS